MPNFVDSSYVMDDVISLMKDVDNYHTENQTRIVEELRKLFLSKEADVYQKVKTIISTVKSDETLLKNGATSVDMDMILKKYQNMINEKQFFIDTNNIKSIESVLDRCSVKSTEDKEVLHKYLDDYILPAVDIVSNDTVQECWDYLRGDDYMDTLIRPWMQEQQRFVVDNMSHKYEKLYKNFAGIFFKVIGKTMDIPQLSYMLNMIQKINNNNISQHNASVKIGQQLNDKYM